MVTRWGWETGHGQGSSALNTFSNQVLSAAALFIYRSVTQRRMFMPTVRYVRYMCELQLELLYNLLFIRAGNLAGELVC